MLVTIGIPFFNGRLTLPTAIQSVFAQTYQHWELLLVDDGSTDDSLQIARAVRDERVRVISDGVNRGVSYRHNQIAEMARGLYIAKLDDDDAMHPERLQKQIAYLQEHGDIDVLASCVYTLSDDNRVSGLRMVPQERLTHAAILAHSVLVQPSIIGKTSWFRKHPYDGAYVRAEDHELWCRTYPHTSFRAMPEPLTFYREGRFRTVRKYRLSHRTDRRIYLRYGPAIVGWRATAALYAKSHAKTWAYCTLKALRLEQVAFNHSRIGLSTEATAAAQSALDRVLRTPVPGLSSTSVAQTA